MKKLIFLFSILCILLLPVWAWGVTDCSGGCYIRTGGSDANTGLSDDDSHAWITLGFAWANADPAKNATFYVQAGNYYSEVIAQGGPNSGLTWTYQFASGQTNIRFLNNTDTFIFDTTTSRSGTVYFIGGVSSAPKTTKFDQGYYEAGSDSHTVTNNSFWRIDIAGATFYLRDLELSGDGGTGGIPVSTANVPSIYFQRLYVHGYPSSTSSFATGHRYFQSCFFYNMATSIRLGTDAGNCHIYNCTFYNTSSATSNIRASAGAKATGEVRIKNNLLISDIALATLTYFIQFEAYDVTDVVISNNMAWKTTGLGTRTENNYPQMYDPQATWINNLIAVDPAWTGSSTVPSVGSTSLTINRGTSTGVTTDFAGITYPSNSIGCSAVVSGTKQYITRSNKTILMAGDSWFYELLNKSHVRVGRLACEGTSACSPAWDADFTGYTFVKQTGIDTLPGLAGIELNRYREMITELTQTNTPSVIVFDGGLNDPTWSGAKIGSMHNALADDLNDLYATGDKPIIISVGLGPEDGNTPTSTIADAAEAVIGPYFQTQGYRSVLFTKHAKKCAGGVSDLYTAGDDVHPDGTGWAFLVELVKAAILSEQYITGDSITKMYQGIKDVTNATFGYKYGLTVAGDSAVVKNTSVSGFGRDGILVQGEIPTINNCISSGNATSAGNQVRQGLTGTTLGALTEDYNNFRGSLLVNGSDPGDAAHSLTADPLFISVTDLRQSSPSAPGIFAGTGTTPTTDYLGLPSPVIGAPAYSIGAYEPWNLKRKVF
jgi:hypothetical protein